MQNQTLAQTLSVLPDGSVLAGGANPQSDCYRVVLTVGADISLAAICLEALTHNSLPNNGPGRYPGRGPNNDHSGTFLQDHWTVTAQLPNRKGPIALEFDRAWADHGDLGAMKSNGFWTIAGNGEGRSCTSVWSLPAPVPLVAGTTLTFEMNFEGSGAENLGHFRLSVSANRAAFDRQSQRFAVTKLADPQAFEHEKGRLAATKAADPWARLAAAYHLIGDQQSRDKLLERRPAAAAGLGDLCAANRDWAGAIAAYRRALTDQPTDAALLDKLATAYHEAGRTREAVPVLASELAIDSNDTLLLLKVAALQAWFGQNDKLAVTCTSALEFAKDTQEPATAERTAKICSLRSSSDRRQIDAALALARRSVEIGTGNGALPWYQMALGMAEYRSGHFAEATAALEAAADNAKVSKDLGPAEVFCVTGTSAFYRAMGLFRQGKKDEARKLATEAAAKMTPLPEDERNPLAGGAGHDDLILWLAYKAAKAMVMFDADPLSKAESDKK